MSESASQLDFDEAFTSPNTTIMTRTDGEARTFKRGQIVIFQGTPGEQLYSLKTGSLGVVLVPKEAHPTEEQIKASGIQVAVLDKPDTLFGEIGLLGGTSGASVVCQSATAVIDFLPIRRENWEEQLAKYPHIAFRLCHLLANRVQDIAVKLANGASFASTLRQSLRHFATEFVDIVEKADSATKKRVFTEVDADLRRITERLTHYRNRNYYLLGSELGQSEGVKHDRSAPSHDKPGDALLTLQKGEVLFRDREPAGALYMVFRGELEMVIGEMRIGVVKPDYFIGGMAMFCERSKAQVFTVRAAEPSILVRVAQTLDDFEHLVNNHPWLVAAIARDLALHLRAYNDVATERYLVMKEETEYMGVRPDKADQIFHNLGMDLIQHPVTRDLYERAINCEARVCEVRTNLLTELRDKASPMVLGK